MEDKLVCKIDSEYNKCWYFNGKIHRTAGAALEWEGGFKYWYLNGERIDCKTQEEFEHYMKYKAFL